MAKVEDPFAMSNVLSTCGLVGIIGNALIIVRYGRRRILLITGLLLSGLLQLLMAIVYDRHGGTAAAGRGIVACTALYFFFFDVSFPCWPLPTLAGRGF